MHGGSIPRRTINSELVDVLEREIGEEVETIGNTLLSPHTHGDISVRVMEEGKLRFMNGLILWGRFASA